MYFVSEFVDAMETAVGARVDAGHMVTVVGKLFAGCEAWCFADDLVGLDDELFAIAVLDDPFTTEQRDDAV